jgi:acetyltransferase-like isoleucine patch superfamily enzyme
MGKKLLHHLYLFISDFRSPLFDKIRAAIIKQLCIAESQNLVVMSGNFFEGLDSIEIGDNVSFNQDCFISGYGGLRIGDNVSIGHRVSILSTDHIFGRSDLPIRDQGITREEVVISDDVWIGANVTILAGVFIPSGTVIAAGSVVTKSFQGSDSILAGIPAKIIKSRLTKQ